VIKPGDNLIEPGGSSGCRGLEGILEIKESDMDGNGRDVIKLDTDIYRVEDPEWATRSGWKPNRDSTSPAKLVATLGMDVPRELLQLKPKSLGGERYYRIKYRAVPMWDGLEARWWMVSFSSLVFQGSRTIF
jgi:hypothetical protein